MNTDHVIVRLLFLLLLLLSLGWGIGGGSGSDRGSNSECLRICEVFFRL